MFTYRQAFKDREMDYKLIPFGLSRDGFRALLKQKISRKSMEEFFNKKINESNILKYTTLLKKEFYIKDEPDKNKPGYVPGIDNRKYLLDLILIALYEEAIDITEVFSLLSDVNKTTEYLIELFEQIAFLELGLFSLDLSGITLPQSKYYNKIYITDNIKLLTFGEKYRSSYQSAENIYNEVSNLYELSKERILEAGDITYLSDLDFFNNTLYPSVSVENTISSLTKINRFPANIEETNISIFSFLFNFITIENTGTVYSESLLRKFYAVSLNGSNTRGSYKKVVGIDAEGKDIVETKYFDKLDGISYYDTLKTMFSNEAQYKRINEFLHKFWKFILERTINY